MTFTVPILDGQGNRTTAVVAVTVAQTGQAGSTATADNTGWKHTGVQLRPYTGPLKLTSPGLILDGYDFPGPIELAAPNIKVTRSRINGAQAAFGVIHHNDGSAPGCLLEDFEVYSAGGCDRAISSQAPGKQTALMGQGLTMRRGDIHTTQRGIDLGWGSTVESCIVHDLVNNSAGNHATAVKSNGGIRHITLHNSVFQCGTSTASSAISAYDDYGHNEDWQMTFCTFATTGGYCGYLGNSMKTTNGGDTPYPNGTGGTNLAFVFTDNLIDDVTMKPFGGLFASWNRATVGTAPALPTGNVWARNVRRSSGLLIPEPANYN